MVVPIPEENYSVKWCDDFTGVAGAIDTSKWNIVLNKPGDQGKDGNEVSSNTDSTSNVSLYVSPSGDKTLRVTPQKDSAGNWTSARIEGKMDGGGYTCPPLKRILLQAELRLGSAPPDKQVGIWPGFWALGASFHPDYKWPSCGEWDIMETAYGQKATLASLHYGTDVYHQLTRGGGGDARAWKDLDVRQFHHYALKVNRSDTDWRKEQIEWFVDGDRWYTVTGADVGDEDWWRVLAHSPFFPIFDVAVGSYLPNRHDPQPKKKVDPNENTATGMDTGMEVRYVAFYESDYSGWPSWEPDHP